MSWEPPAAFKSALKELQSAHAPGPDAPRAEYLPAPRMIRLHNRVMTLDEARADFAALSLALRQSAEHEAAHHADPHIEAWHHLGAKPQPVARPSRWRGMWWRVRTAVQFLLGD